jgi:hypothetical protein
MSPDRIRRAAVGAPPAPNDGCLGRVSHPETYQLSQLSAACDQGLPIGCQPIENKHLLGTIRQAFVWHADCSPNEVSATSIQGCLGGERRLHRLGTELRRHVMTSAAGAGKNRGKRE